MTDRARPVISLFKTPKPAEPIRATVAQIPIRTVSRAAIEELVARLSKSLETAA